MIDIIERAENLSQRLVAARTAHRQAEHTLAQLLAELSAERLYRPLGYHSLEEYASIKLELTARQARDLVRIGRAFSTLPRLDVAMREGKLDWTKARELVRVATPETEQAWITRAGEVTSRVLERQVAAAVPGQGPPDGGARAEPLRTLVVRMESTDYETVRTAISLYHARTEARGDEIDDGAALAAIARRYIADLDSEGDRPPTAERYQIVIEHCPSCGAAHTSEAEISDTIAAEAVCDAEIVEMRPGPKQGHVSRTIPPAVRQVVLARAHRRCEVPGCRNQLWLDIHHTHQRCDGGDNDPRGLVCLCDGHHRAVHAGYMGVERTRDGKVVVFRADGSATIGRRAHTHVGPVTRPGTEASVADARKVPGASGSRTDASCTHGLRSPTGTAIDGSCTDGSCTELQRDPHGPRDQYADARESPALSDAEKAHFCNHSEHQGRT